MRAPLFWHDGSFPSRLLLPLSWLYRAGFDLRAKTARPFKAAAPIICIGNLVAGGAGKTPVAMAIANILQQRGKSVTLLTRGHGGSLRGPHLIDVQRHHASDVGDETLLLAACAPTIMAKNRAHGAKTAADAGAKIILMDDGFQNPTLKKDFSFVVVDGHFGFGNGRLLPAGPLREPLQQGLARADAFVLIGEDRHGLAPMLSAKHTLIRAHMELDESVNHIRGQRVVAFAGIGRPEKFFRSLREFGCEVKNATGFPDHYRFRESDLLALRAQADKRKAILVTTAKDYARIPEPWREGITVAPAHLVIEDEKTLLSLLTPYL